MRINKFVAQATGLSRRAADHAINEGRVSLNTRAAQLGDNVEEGDSVILDSQRLNLAAKTTIIFNKPAGYVCSRQGQGSRTIYDLLPAELHALKPVGRLDKDSSGLLVLTNDGQLAHELTHPRFAKTKVYEATLDKPLEPLHHQMINDHGIQLEDGLSKLTLAKLNVNGLEWQVTMSEGRNRQIRRTFEALGYAVTKLHRTHFGPYSLNGVNKGELRLLG